MHINTTAGRPSDYNYIIFQKKKKRETIDKTPRATPKPETGTDGLVWFSDGYRDRASQQAAEVKTEGDTWSCGTRFDLNGVGRFKRRRTRQIIVTYKKRNASQMVAQFERQHDGDQRGIKDPRIQAKRPIKRNGDVSQKRDERRTRIRSQRAVLAQAGKPVTIQCLLKQE